MLSTIIFQMAVRTVKQMDRLEQRAGRAIALAVSAGPFDLGKFFSTGEISLTLRGKGGVCGLADWGVHGFSASRFRGGVWGHQNQRPSSAAIAGVMNERTIRVSNSRPNAMVVPTCPTVRSSLIAMELRVNAKTSPADVTTAPVPAIARMIPVLKPALISSLNRDTRSKL